jgi:hypothetical protein
MVDALLETPKKQKKEDSSSLVQEGGHDDLKELKKWGETKK